MTSLRKRRIKVLLSLKLTISHMENDSIYSPSVFISTHLSDLASKTFCRCRRDQRRRDPSECSNFRKTFHSSSN